MIIQTALILSTAASAGLASDYRSRFPLPDLTVPSGWGVNIHFTDPAQGEMAMIARAGFQWVRMDFAWGSVERERGRYDFSAYDRLMAALKAHRIRPVFILDYGNDLYGKVAPATTEARAAFAAFAARSVAHFKGRGIVWEMWNEPNIGFWQPTPNVADYARLALATGEAMRRAEPQEWYVGPATSGFDWAFLEGCFRAGLLKVWDAVTVHPYRGSNPETVLTDWARLRALTARYGRADVPLISGEWGYSELYGGMDRDKQARYAVRQYLTNLVAGVGLSIWYDWKDDGPDPKEPEHHFGTVFQDLRPKGTYGAMAAMARALRGKRFHLRLTSATGDRWVCVFVGKGAPKAVGWSPLAGGSPTARVLGEPDVLPSALDRAAVWSPLPFSARVGSAEDAASLLRPFVANLRHGERLEVFVWAPAADSAQPALILNAGDGRHLARLCSPLVHMPSEREPGRTWRICLMHGKRTPLWQECDVTFALKK